MSNRNQVFRLTPEAYDHLEKAVGAMPAVSNETSPLQAGYQLGVQRVLKVLRDGFTISRTS